MRLRHPHHTGHAVRLAYCHNLAASETLADLLASLRAVTLPLRERLAQGRPFGVGMYVPARLAARLAGGGKKERDQLIGFFAEHGLEACTWNAFPYGGFQSDGLKERVFTPTWLEAERAAFTRNVAQLAVELAGPLPNSSGGHVSISTHTGMHGARCSDTQRDGCARAFGQVATELAHLEEERGRRVVLALEAEPRASCNDTAELARFLVHARELAPDGGTALERHVGACLDACHAAVEFEFAAAALKHSTGGGTPLGKLQWSSALALLRPQDPVARARFAALDEPRYLHQVTGQRADGTLLRLGDLRELRACDDEAAQCEELRCHFHVPIDRAGLGGGLATTRGYADELVRTALRQLPHWSTPELHLEIETYTWDVLPPELRPTSPGALCDALEREYRHALAVLADQGWHPE